MKEQKWNDRERRRKKSKDGMQMDNKSAFLLEEQKVKRATKIKKENEHGK